MVRSLAPCVTLSMAAPSHHLFNIIDTRRVEVTGKRRVVTYSRRDCGRRGVHRGYIEVRLVPWNGPPLPMLPAGGNHFYRRPRHLKVTTSNFNLKINSTRVKRPMTQKGTWKGLPGPRSRPPAAKPACSGIGYPRKRTYTNGPGGNRHHTCRDINPAYRRVQSARYMEVGVLVPNYTKQNLTKALVQPYSETAPSPPDAD